MPSKNRPWSLTDDLKWRQLGLFAALWLAGAVIASAFILHETNEIFDNAMAEAANVVLAFSAAGGPMSEADLARAEKLALSGDRRKYMSFQVRDAAGRIVTKSSQAPAEPYPVPLRNGYVGRGATKYLTRPFPSGLAFVQVAEYHDERRDSFLGLLAGFLVPLLGLMGLGAALLSRSIAKVGKPISELSLQLQARNGANLSAIDDLGMPRELEPIVQDVNRLFERLKGALDAERAFSANCAHELRNPIASARAHAEFMARFPDDASNGQRAKALEGSLLELGHRIERLLQLSRAEAGASLATRVSDLVAVARLLVEEYQRRGKHIRFDPGSAPALHVAIDQDAVGIAIQNLIDNALANADAGTPVDVRIEAPGTLRVANACAVVASADLARLIQRFERGSPAKLGGYGLGLAIVGELMRQTGGRLDLRSPATGRNDGFEAIVAFQAAEPTAAAG